MSMPDRTVIKCKECGSDYEFGYYHSINVSLDPELRDKVITGEIFHTVCPICGHEDYVLFPFLYHDMEHNFMICVSSPEDIERRFNEMKSQQEAVAKDFPGMPMPEIHQATFDHYDRMETLIIALEKGFDMDLVDIYLGLECQELKKTLEGVNGFDGIHRCYLHDIDGVTKIVFELSDDGHGFNIDFSTEKYDAVRKAVEELAAKENKDETK